MAEARYALYFTPAPDSPLARFGAGILGYDAYAGTEAARTALPGIAEAEAEQATAEPRRYGFHATLKAPFRLAPGGSAEELGAALRAFAQSRPAVAVGRLRVAALGRFLALVPDEPAPDLSLLAAECVAAFDGFRAPPSPGERVRRLDGGLSARQRALFERWGYPYVFEEFRFHMTLTGPLGADRRPLWSSRLAQVFGEHRHGTVFADAVTLLRQDHPGARFRVVERVALQSRAS